ncbi:MepB family protein [Paenarthrobacter sp. NPDC056912]|uniref:MepB family protein n=1 Tax=Paenarthrobacter sp. NPDC056912 TaxID=3345965 RepID=UPI00366D8DBC
MTAQSVHPDVADAVRVLSLEGEECPYPTPEADNLEYGAAIANLRQGTVRFRVGKLTPTKAGLFVAAWRRASGGSTEPFPAEDSTGTLVVTVREGANAGYFAFPKSALVKHGIVSVDGEGGKRGFRIYPPWSVTTNRQATLTQQWQCEYFHQRTGEDSSLPRH